METRICPILSMGSGPFIRCKEEKCMWYCVGEEWCCMKVLAIQVRNYVEAEEE